MKHTIETRWPDYTTTFTFGAIVDGREIWNDENKMPQSLRLLLAAAIRDLDPNSTLGETVLDAIEGELSR